MNEFNLFIYINYEYLIVQIDYKVVLIAIIIYKGYACINSNLPQRIIT